MPKQEKQIAPGCKASLDGLNLTLNIKLDEDGWDSKSGKTKVHATSSGFKMLPNGMVISYNITT